ncbi:hypothetical protein DFS33DRAFT_964394 [Desarmillaria ectypa]|nr:hypothetical protein DFS33DRAFT_964394 [Desarmillaria ectypa]
MGRTILPGGQSRLWSRSCRYHDGDQGLLGEPVRLPTLTHTVEDIVVETISSKAIVSVVEPVEPTVTPTLTTFVHYPPSQAFVQTPPGRSAPMDTRAPSNLVMLTALVLSTIIVMVATSVMVLKRASKTFVGSFVSNPSPCTPPCLVARSSAWHYFLSLVSHLFVLGMTIGCGIFVLQNLDYNEPLPALDGLLLLFGSLREHVGLVAVLVIIPTVSFIPWRKQVRGEVTEVDTLAADCVEHGEGSRPASNLQVEVITDTTSLLYNSLVRGNAFRRFILRHSQGDVDFAVNIPLAQDICDCRCDFVPGDPQPVCHGPRAELDVADGG